MGSATKHGMCRKLKGKWEMECFNTKSSSLCLPSHVREVKWSEVVNAVTISCKPVEYLPLHVLNSIAENIWVLFTSIVFTLLFTFNPENVYTFKIIPVI